MSVNVVDGLVVAFCGVGLILAVWLGQVELALAIATGLMGYLGGGAVAGRKVEEDK